MNTCRNRQELEALEQQLHFETAKDWNMRLSAHGRVGNLQRALDMPGEMRDAGIRPNVIVYTNLIKACRRQWQKAYPLLEQMRAEGIKPNAITYTHLIKACDRHWQEALALLDEMRDRDGVEPNVYTYSAAISA